MTKILIGIDPGAETGFSVTRDGNLSAVKTLSFWSCIEELETMKNAFSVRVYEKADGSLITIDSSLIVYIEAPHLVPPTFNRGEGRKVNEKISQNVGENKAHSKLLIAYCERNGINVVPVKPTGGPLTKMDDAFFRKLTGWTKRTSQHGRDSVSMIWGR